MLTVQHAYPHCRSNMLAGRIPKVSEVFQVKVTLGEKEDL